MLSLPRSERSRNAFWPPAFGTFPERPERGRPRTEAVACVLSTVPAQISTDGHERPGSLLLITRRKTSPTTVAHRNISRVPTLHGSRFHSSLLNLPRYYLSDAKNSPATFQFSHRSEACRRESPKGPCLASHNSGQAQWSFS